jgi:hypothetical protein
MSARWWAPVGIGALAVAGSLVAPAVASAGVDLPPRSAEQLLTDLQAADVRAVQGTVEVAADLGLPALPTVGQNAFGSSTDALALLSGTTTLRVWASEDGARVAVHGTIGESDVSTDGTQLWTWSSATSAFTHMTLPTPGDVAGLAAKGGLGKDGLGKDGLGPLAGLEGLAGHLGADGTGRTDDPTAAALLGLTPEAMSKAILAALDPATEVTSGPGITVAGRPAYQLVLTPRDDATLVGPVRIAIDAAQHVPVRVSIESTATGRAAFTVGFTSVSFQAPDPSVYRLTPPAGAVVTERDLGAELRADGEPGGAAGGDAAGAPDDSSASMPDMTPTVVGEGWSAVLVLSGFDPSAEDGTASGADASPLAPSGPITELTSWLDALPQVSGSWGTGRLLSSHLLSVLVTDDGRLLVGAVAPEALEAAAAR